MEEHCAVRQEQSSPMARWRTKKFGVIIETARLAGMSATCFSVGKSAPDRGALRDRKRATSGAGAGRRRTSKPARAADLPLNFHPVAIRASAVSVTPYGAV